MWGHFKIVLNLRNPNLRSLYLEVYAAMRIKSHFCIVCFSQDDGSWQRGLYKKNHCLEGEWAGFRQTKLSDSQLRIGRGAGLSTDKVCNILPILYTITVIITDYYCCWRYTNTTFYTTTTLTLFWAVYKLSKLGEDVKYSPLTPSWPKSFLQPPGLVNLFDLLPLSVHFSWNTVNFLYDSRLREGYKVRKKKFVEFSTPGSGPPPWLVWKIHPIFFKLLASFWGTLRKTSFFPLVKVKILGKFH